MINLKKILNVFQIPSEKERHESILNGAVDLYDLEFRMRELDRGSM
ncbi:DUF3563 family protein [uncultured Cohaesibacter sp.]|nr:DUF3563 family protein [uncultured Cohaesibacter sp.]